MDYIWFAIVWSMHLWITSCVTVLGRGQAVVRTVKTNDGGFETEYRLELPVARSLISLALNVPVFPLAYYFFRTIF